MEPGAGERIWPKVCLTALTIERTIEFHHDQLNHLTDGPGRSRYRADLNCLLGCDPARPDGKTPIASPRT